MKYWIKYFFPLLFSVCGTIYSQYPDSSETVIIVPGEEYSANGLHELFFGAHWRDVWTAPIEVQVLDLDNFAGGLTPIKKGGGLQTKSLRFKGNDGQIWKFRSINKDPSKALPPELRESIAEDILQDQISTSNPMASIIVPPILNAVDIINAEPMVVYLPDTEKLAEYREEFGGLLGTIEIHPDEGDDDEFAFADADDIKGTYKLLNHLEKKRSEKINAREFLKARLIDILLGDWDRHMDQWRWAKYEGDNDGEWYPIPRDRDQAFSKYDGIFPFIAAYLIPQLNHFDFNYPQVEDLTWNGRFIDRRVLLELDKLTWNEITNEVQGKITDEVIKKAVSKLPANVYSISNEEIREKLISRRNKLHLVSVEYYRLINKFADIFCSAKDDFVIVNRISDSETEVTVYRRDKESDQPKGEAIFYKLFDNEITIDIRIHLNDGDDKVLVKGECNFSPVVRVIGDDGKDEFVDESIVHGYFLSVTPFPSIQERTIFYDSGDKTEVETGEGTVFDDSEYEEPINEGEKYEPQKIDRGHNWLLIPILGYDSDNGLTFGAGLQLDKYNFRMDPLEYRQKIFGSYATNTQSLSFGYEGDFYSPVRSGRLNILAVFTEEFTTRYFGYGNETVFNSEKDKNDFYEVNQALTTIYPTLYYSFSDRITGSIGISFIQTNTKVDSDTLLTDFRFGNYGTGKLNPLGLHIKINIDHRSNINFAKEGYYIEAGISSVPSVFNVTTPFYTSTFDFRGYITPKEFDDLTIALRTGGAISWGTYPFFAGAAIGGLNSLRGYNNKRFSGDAAIFGQFELRYFITPINLILKSKLGVNVFAETGRVFAKGENSSLWHPSYGLGLWLSYLNNELLVSTYLAASPERIIYVLGLGMGF